MATYILIEITQHAVTLTRRDSGEALVERLAADEPGGAWDDGLGRLRTRLAALVTRAGVRGARTVLLAESPESGVEFRSTPAPPAEARQAALLALRESGGFAPGVDPSAAAVLWRDTHADPALTHTLAVGDRAARVEALIEAVEAAGLTVTAVIPPRAVTLASAVRRATEAPTGAGLIAALHLDDHAGALTASERGRLLLLRPVDASVQRLVDALTRPIQTARGEVRLTDADARELLRQVGVPAPGAIVDPATGLRAADVLPLIQPVLQRLVVEIKQSLRFGLAESDRARAALRLNGPGSAIPGLARVLAAEAELPLDESTPGEVGAGMRPAEIERLAQRVNLLPPRAVSTRVSGRARRGLLVGLGLAAVVLGADAAATALEARALRARLAALTPMSRQFEEVQAAFALASATLASAQNEAARVAQTAPPRANWAAFLADLSRRTPAAIRLTRISGAEREGVPVAALEGLAQAETDEEARASITDLAAALDESALVSRATLGGVRRAGDEWAFTIEVRLTPIPRSPVSRAHAEGAS